MNGSELNGTTHHKSDLITNKGFLSPSSDSSESLFNFNNGPKGDDKPKSELKLNCESDKIEFSLDESSEELRRPSNKRSCSPNSSDLANRAPLKKAKETKTQTSTEEELLETLPPSSANLQSNPSSRLITPPLSVVKNSIKVNIGCNKK